MPHSSDKSFFSSDKNLWLRLKKHKDKEAFLDAYEAYAQDLYRFLYFKIGNREEAQDLVSAVFTKAWTYVAEGKLKSDNNYKSLRAFLYQIARNQAIDYWRAKRPDNFSAIGLDGEAMDIPAEGNLAAEVEAKAETEVLLSQLKKLKSEYQSVLLLYYVDELSVAEIANVLGKSKGNVRVTVFRALKALRELMTK